jgi:uncharacterized protein YbjT (DUF2867 family)
MDDKRVLVTGATGYIASRLIPNLLESGYRVRCLARQSLRLKARAWFPHVEVVRGDIIDSSTLAPAMEGVHTAYYLVHSMASGQGYTSLELDGARNLVTAAEQAGVKHIIYLGGLADPKGKIADHMRSRIETGETLRAGNVPVTEFRAGVIVGPGSISFEMIRFMTELMPIICGPTWLKNMSQPIAVKNVIDYLLAALENRAGQGKIFEIGGPDRMSYADLMVTYGRLRGLQRISISVPGIPLWFMAAGVALMTPVPAEIARPLVDGLQSDSLVLDDSAHRTFPHIQLIGYEEGVKNSLEQLHPERLEPAWADCEKPVNVMKHEGFFIDHRCREVDAAPETVFQVVSALGGKNGWLYADWLWRLRGWLDWLLGGPGMRGRSTPLPEEVPSGDDKVGGAKVGDYIDFYRVDAVEDGQLWRLHSELKAPGDGWMEWHVENANGTTRLSQTGFFAPRGLPGFVYWYLFGPLHKLVFRGLIKTIARKSVEKN